MFNNARFGGRYRTSDSKRSMRLQGTIFVCGALVGSSTYLGLQLPVDLSSNLRKTVETSQGCARRFLGSPCEFARRRLFLILPRGPNTSTLRTLNPACTTYQTRNYSYLQQA